MAAVLGLANVFGQGPSTVRAEASAATVSLYAPTAIRGGDLMEARFHITARQQITHLSDVKFAILETNGSISFIKT